jgi:hypothetical protein
MTLLPLAAAHLSLTSCPTISALAAPPLQQQQQQQAWQAEQTRRAAWAVSIIHTHTFFLPCAPHAKHARTTVLCLYPAALCCRASHIASCTFSSAPLPYPQQYYAQQAQQQAQQQGAPHVGQQAQASLLPQPQEHQHQQQPPAASAPSGYGGGGSAHGGGGAVGFGAAPAASPNQQHQHHQQQWGYGGGSGPGGSGAAGVGTGGSASAGQPQWAWGTGKDHQGPPQLPVSISTARSPLKFEMKTKRTPAGFRQRSDDILGADDESEAFVTAHRPSAAAGRAAHARGAAAAAAAAHAASPLAWSDSLKRYVNRAFASCSSDAERNKMEESLKAVITARCPPPPPCSSSFSSPSSSSSWSLLFTNAIAHVIPTRNSRILYISHVHESASSPCNLLYVLHSNDSLVPLFQPTPTHQIDRWDNQPCRLGPRAPPWDQPPSLPLRIRGPPSLCRQLRVAISRRREGWVVWCLDVGPAAAGWETRGKTQGVTGGDTGCRRRGSHSASARKVQENTAPSGGCRCRSGGKVDRLWPRGRLLPGP